MSQSGDYRAEGWRGGNMTEHRTFHLTVCAEGGEEESYVAYDGSAVLCSLNSTLDHGSSIQLYRSSAQYNLIQNHYKITWSDWTLVLDTDSSLEPLVEDLRGRLQVDLNTSQVTLAGLRESPSVFCCAVWRGAQCQSYSYRDVSTLPKYVFAYEEENVTLPCILKGELPRKVHWVFHNGSVQSSINQTQPQEVMYMLNGNQTDNYSLIIPSVSLQHSGRYTCVEHDSTTEMGFLFVCMKFSLLDVVFSHGESVLLDITEHLNESFIPYHSIQWYRQKVFQPQVLIVDFHNTYKTKLVPLPEDLRGRVTVSNLLSNSTLTISNLTAEDSGLYTWRVYGRKGTLGNEIYFCFEGTFRLVYRDPFGVHSPFYRAYAPLMGCVLLGLVTAVI
ncbi:uncharacterized protein LOC121718939 [Alosa sapidissima]|uniref:uncharacterized protein LOC121718939 n=1 Tax=Alosa sapidissima TaxID=34773 RepID=UPI001C093A3A|nr:uncharacterized protein LOC121718939 [Alosa sapidissima]